jgi:outer membrane protein assembly factor BamB
VEPGAESLRLFAGVTPVSYSGPVLAGDKLVFGSERFGLTALRKETGRRLWQKRFSDEVAAVPLVHESSVFVGTDSGSLYRLSLDSGAQAWSASLGAPVHGSMVMAFNRLYAASADDAIHALDPATGRILWTYRRPALGGTSIRGGGHPSAVDGRIWVGFSDGALVALEPQTGTVEVERIYRDNLKFMDLDAKVIGWKDGLLISTYDGRLRHTRKDGSLLWEFGAGGARAPIVAEGDIIYLPASDGNVYAISGSTGRELWRYSLRRGVPTGMALIASGAEKYLVVAGSQERLIVLNAATGAMETQVSLGRGSGSFAPIAHDGTSFYVLSNYSRIYQFRLNL